MTGLQQTSAANASLLLNLESVLTALLAWVVFKEHTDFKIVFGMIIIVIGGVLLSWPNATTAEYSMFGSLAIAGACLCWAIDNNLTRKISLGDVLFIAASKGAIAGLVNISIAVAFNEQFPVWSHISAVLTIGFIGYGASLVLFVLALRGLGTARTGAYFCTAPFIGATIAIIFFHEITSGFFWTAFILMAVGVWLHLTERHSHEHVHDAFEHDHTHTHDEHHQHDHDFPWDGKEPHAHQHPHKSLKHSHHHYPDIHHRHKH